MDFKYKVVDRLKPVFMVNEFKEGTKVNIISEIDKDYFVITNGRHIQYCRKSQIEKMED